MQASAGTCIYYLLRAIYYLPVICIYRANCLLFNAVGAAARECVPSYTMYYVYPMCLTFLGNLFWYEHLLFSFRKAGTPPALLAQMQKAVFNRKSNLTGWQAKGVGYIS